jgi:pSer/pThr/pTyr-binding forkhead associated (FHA) protein
VVVTSAGEWELESGSLTIGRDGNADVVVADPLASRFHARLSVESDARVILEDLHSANGIFVNGFKLSTRSVPLSEGDRLLLGTTEISVFGQRTSSMVCVGGRLARLSPRVHTAPTLRPGPATNSSELSPKRAALAAGRKDAVDLVGISAEQLMESGHPLEAVRVLSEHLRNLLGGASAGLNVPANILESATRYALRLHSWTQRDSWVRYVLELHMACRQVTSEASLQALEIAFGNSALVDRALIRSFIRTIEGRPEPITPDEQARLLRIEHLDR